MKEKLNSICLFLSLMTLEEETAALFPNLSRDVKAMCSALRDICDI